MEASTLQHTNPETEPITVEQLKIEKSTTIQTRDNSLEPQEENIEHATPALSQEKGEEIEEPVAPTIEEGPVPTTETHAPAPEEEIQGETAIQEAPEKEH